MVSIVIPCWGYGKYLARSIESAINQTIKCDVFVLDNFSTDETAEVIKKYPIRSKRTDRLLDWRQAFNEVVNNSKGEYVVFLGADDYLEPNFVEKTLPLMKKGVGVVRTGLKCFGEMDHLMLPPDDPYNILDNNTTYITSLMRKEAFDSVGGIDEYIPGYEDWDMWIRFVLDGWEFKTINEPLWNYNIHRDSGYFLQLPLDKEIREYIKRKYT